LIDVDQTPTIPSQTPDPPPWFNRPGVRWGLYVLGQTANGVLMFAKLDSEGWLHVACCIVIFVLGTVGVMASRIAAQA